MRWYVVHAYSGYEKRVAATLQERVELYQMQDSFGEIVVPTETVEEIKDGKKRKSERKFYPGYVMVEMEMNNDTWHFVKSTPRVLGFIGDHTDTARMSKTTRGKSAEASEAPVLEKGQKARVTPLSPAEADAILQRVKEGSEKPARKTEFEPGESVRVIEGPFADFNGTVEKVNYEKNRLQVSVAIFGRSTPVELEFSQVEKT